MRNIGAVSSNNSAANLGSANGTSSIFAATQQSDSALGGFEGILEQLAALISADQTGQGDQGDSSGTLTGSGSLVDSSQSSQNSKQTAWQFSQNPNGSLAAATAANGPVTGDQGSQTTSTDGLGLGSASQKGTTTSQKSSDQDDKSSSQQSDTSLTGVDPFMIAAAAAAALQSPVTPAPAVDNTASTTDSAVANTSTLFDSSAAANLPAASTIPIPQNAPADTANVSVPDNSQLAVNVSVSAANGDVANVSGLKNNFKATAGLTPAVTKGAAQSTSGASTGIAQKAAALQQPAAAIAQNSSSSSSSPSPMQAQLESLSGMAEGASKKDSGQAEVTPASGKDVRNSLSSLAAGLQGGQTNNSFGNGQVAASANSVEQAVGASSGAGASGSLTMQELSAMQAAGAGTKKANEPGKTGTSSEEINFSSLARAEAQIHAQGSSEKAVTSDLATQTGTNPFGALDSAPTTSEQQAQLLKASHKEMEVGVQDPQYGWVEVKTQMNAGQVSASLSVSTAEAQHALQQELPAMQHFMASRDLDLSSLSVSTGTDSGAGMYHQQSGQGTGEQNQSFNQIPAGEAWGGQPSSKIAPVTTTENVWMPETASRISVMA